MIFPFYFDFKVFLKRILIREGFKGNRRFPLEERKGKKEVKIRRVMVEKEKEVTVFGRIFPLAKSDENEGIRRKKIIFFIASPEFAAYMTSEFEVINSFNLTHPITKHFDNSGILLKLIGGLRNLSRNPRIDQLSSLGLMSTTTSSILNHFLSLRII